MTVTSSEGAAYCQLGENRRVEGVKEKGLDVKKRHAP
jgi:hypothetical protein